MGSKVLSLAVAMGLAGCVGDAVEQAAEQESLANVEVRWEGENQATIVLWGRLADEALDLLSLASPYPNQDRIKVDDTTIIRFPDSYSSAAFGPFEDLLCIRRPGGPTECRSPEFGQQIAALGEVVEVLSDPTGRGADRLVSRPGLTTTNSDLAKTLFDSMKRIAALSPQEKVETLGPDRYRSTSRTFECAQGMETGITCTIVDRELSVDRVSTPSTVVVPKTIPYQTLPGPFGTTDVVLTGSLAEDILLLFTTAPLAFDGYEVRMAGSERERVLCLKRGDASRECGFVLETPPIQSVPRDTRDPSLVRFRGPAASTLYGLLAGRAAYDPSVHAGAGRYVLRSLECIPLADGGHSCRIAVPPPDGSF